MLHVWKLDFEQNHAEPDPIIIISQTSIFTSLTLVGPPSRECAKNLAMEPAEWPWPVRSGNWGRFCCQLPSPATWMKFGHLGLPNTCNTKEPQQGLCYVGYVVAQCVVMFLFVTLTNWCNDFKHLLKTGRKFAICFFVYVGLRLFIVDAHFWQAISSPSPHVDIFGYIVESPVSSAGEGLEGPW